MCGDAESRSRTYKAGHRGQRSYGNRYTQRATPKSESGRQGRPNSLVYGTLAVYLEPTPLAGACTGKSGWQHCDADGGVLWQAISDRRWGYM